MDLGTWPSSLSRNSSSCLDLPKIIPPETPSSLAPFRLPGFPSRLRVHVYAYCWLAPPMLITGGRHLCLDLAE